MSPSHDGDRVSPAQLITLLLFICGLVLCISTGLSLLWALGAGIFLFGGYAFHVGIPLPEIARLLLKGIRRIENIIVIFLLIGMLTGVWRLSGTIPMLIDEALALIDPTFFILWCFLLCGALSSLIGTAFGTVSTLGVICMLMAHTAGFNEIYTGGAILSGVYIGDRCSPMSSSAALVCALTHTDIYGNFKRMLRCETVPFLLACAGYAALSLLDGTRGTGMDAAAPLRENFRYGFLVLAPALVILVLGILRVNVKKAMAASIALASLAALAIQGRSPADLLTSMAFGYTSPVQELAMLEGGGIRSMATVIGIVAISSSYSAIFEKSCLLDSFEHMVTAAAHRFGAFRVTALVSLLCTGLACNQTLSIIMTHQLCSHSQPDRREMAMYLENSVVLLSAVLPWSIAFSMCSLTLQQGPEIIAFAFYLWLMPLYWCLRSRKVRQSLPPHALHVLLAKKLRWI